MARWHNEGTPEMFLNASTMLTLTLRRRVRPLRRLHELQGESAARKAPRPALRRSVVRSRERASAPRGLDRKGP